MCNYKIRVEEEREREEEGKKNGAGE